MPTCSPCKNRWWTWQRARTLTVCGLLLVAVGLVFGQSVGFDTVNYDNPAYVGENPIVSGGLGAGQFNGPSPAAIIPTGTR